MIDIGTCTDTSRLTGRNPETVFRISTHQCRHHEPMFDHQAHQWYKKVAPSAQKFDSNLVCVPGVYADHQVAYTNSQSHHETHFLKNLKVTKCECR